MRGGQYHDLLRRVEAMSEAERVEFVKAARRETGRCPCGKICYRGEKNALNHLRKIRKSGQIVDQANAYKCPICGGWHLGHKKDVG